jgi:mannose-6-phosphate isomerase-like protein (cupin superfamily)
MESALGGVFVRARAELGVSAFGLQVISLPAGFDEPYTRHAHLGMPVEMGFSNHGQEEVYVPLSGRGTLIADDERWELEPGMAVRVGPAQWRQVVTDGEPLQYLAIGGTPGKPYAPTAFSRLGAGDDPVPHAETASSRLGAGDDPVPHAETASSRLGVGDDPVPR